MTYTAITDAKLPVKAWIDGVPVEESALAQRLRRSRC